MPTSTETHGPRLWCVALLLATAEGTGSVVVPLFAASRSEIVHVIRFTVLSRITLSEHKLHFHDGGSAFEPSCIGVSAETEHRTVCFPTQFSHCEQLLLTPTPIPVD